MALLDGQRQWGKRCFSCGARGWAGKRYICNKITLCHQCYPNRQSLRLKDTARLLHSSLDCQFQGALRFDLPWREEEPFLVEKLNVFEAAAAGALNYVKQIVENGGAGPNDLGVHCTTLLGNAVHGGSIPLVDYLISKGGQTKYPFLEHVSLQAKSIEMLRFLDEMDKGTSTWEFQVYNPQVHDHAYGNLTCYENEEDVDWLLAHGMTANPAMPSARIPLLAAITVKAATALIRQGADVKQRDHYSDETVLWTAARCRNLELLQYYIALGVDVHQKDKNGATVLFEAVQHYGNLALIKCLVENGCNPKEMRCSPRETLLFSAVRSGDVSIIQYVLEQGVDPKRPSLKKTWCQHLVTSKNLWRTGNFAIEIVNLLQSYGVELKPSNRRKITAGYNGEPYGDGLSTPLHHVCHAATEITADLLDFIVSKGFTVDDTDDQGRTALLCINKVSCYMTIPWLINKGSNIHHVDACGQNILIVLTEMGGNPFMRFFNNEFKDVQWVQPIGTPNALSNISRCCRSPEEIEIVLQRFPHAHFDGSWSTRQSDALTDTLEGSQREGIRLSVIKFWLQRGASLTDCSHYWKYSIIHTAIKYASSETPPTWRFLIEQGADPTIIGYHGETALFALASSRIFNLGDLEYFIAKGVNLHQVNDSGRNILWDLCARGNLEAVKYLIEEKGMNFKLHDTSRETILLPALTSENHALIRYLVGKGLSLNLESFEGCPLFLNMQIKTYPSCVQTLHLLDELGADLENEMDQEENDMLMCICRNAPSTSPSRMIEMIDYLIDVKKVDVNGSTPEGLSPLLHIIGDRRADEYHYEKVTLHLISKGAIIEFTRSPASILLLDTVCRTSITAFEAIKESIRDPGSEGISFESSYSGVLHNHCVESGTLEMLEYIESSWKQYLPAEYDSAIFTGAISNTKRPEVLQHILRRSSSVMSKMSQAQQTKVIKHALKSLDDIHALKQLNKAGFKFSKLSHALDAIGLITSGRSRQSLEVVVWILKKVVRGVKATVKRTGEIPLPHGWANTAASQLLRSHFLRLARSNNSHIEFVIEILKLLTILGLDVTSTIKLPGLEPPLWYAFQIGNLKLINFLISRQADHHICNAKGQNLFWACVDQNEAESAIETMRLLIKLGLNIYHCDTTGQTVLFRAVETPEHFEISRFLVEEICMSPNSQADDGRSLLACYLSHCQDASSGVRSLLLKHKPDPHQKVDGIPAFAMAAGVGWTDFMEYCCTTHKIDPNVSYVSETLSQIFDNNQSESLKWLFDHGFDFNKVWKLGLIQYGPLVMAAHKASKCDNLGDQDEDDSTALDYDLQPLRMLLDMGVSPNWEMNQSVFEQGISRRRGNAVFCAKFARIIVPHMSPETLNQNSPKTNRTPLGHALFFALPDVFEILLEHGANPNQYQKTVKGWVLPIHLAVLYNQAPWVELLLKHGADIEGTSAPTNNTGYAFALKNLRLPLATLDLLRCPYQERFKSRK